MLDFVVSEKIFSLCYTNSSKKNRVQAPKFFTGPLPSETMLRCHRVILILLPLGIRDI